MKPEDKQMLIKLSTYFPGWWKNDTTADGIREQYKKQAMLLHPDKNPEKSPEERNIKFQELANCYDILKTPRSLEQYRKLYAEQYTSSRAPFKESHRTRQRQARGNNYHQPEPDLTSELFKEYSDYKKSFQLTSEEATMLQNLNTYFPGWWQDSDTYEYIIGRQYKIQAILLHTDKHNRTPQEAENEAKFKEISNCYQILTTPNSLQKYRKLYVQQSRLSQYTSSRATFEESHGTRQTRENNYYQPESGLPSGLFKEYSTYKNSVPKQATMATDVTKGNLAQASAKLFPTLGNDSFYSETNAKKDSARNKTDLPDLRGNNQRDNKPTKTTVDTSTQLNVAINLEYQNLIRQAEQMMDQLKLQSTQGYKTQTMKESLTTLQEKIKSIQKQHKYTYEQNKRLDTLIKQINDVVSTTSFKNNAAEHRPTQERNQARTGGMLHKHIQKFQKQAEDLLNMEPKAEINEKDLLEDLLDHYPGTYNPQHVAKTKADLLFENLDKNQTKYTFDEINRIMNTKNIPIDSVTKSALNEDQIKKIKEIFTIKPNITKLPRKELILKKIEQIQLQLSLHPNDSERVQKLTQMLKYYQDLAAIMNKLRLDLPYSISKNQDQLYIVYRHILGQGAFGRVKLAQNLTTGKVLAAKIQEPDSTPNGKLLYRDAIHIEEEVLRALDRHSATINRAELSISKKTNKEGVKELVEKTKNTIFSDFVEGDTLGKFLRDRMQQLSDIASIKSRSNSNYQHDLKKQQLQIEKIYCKHFYYL
jgi:curved DNA-binding protein CbpA